jgi:hypothetical protein
MVPSDALFPVYGWDFWRVSPRDAWRHLRQSHGRVIPGRPRYQVGPQRTSRFSRIGSQANLPDGYLAVSRTTTGILREVFSRYP